MESLVKGLPGSSLGSPVVPPDKTDGNATGFHWVGSLPCQVQQTSSPKFTPSLHHLFLKIAISAFDQIMNDIGPEKRRKVHSTIHSIALIFTQGKEKCIAPWHSIYEGKSEAMARLVMTWCTCTLARKDVHMGENLMEFINAIDGVIRAIKACTDHVGEIFAMSILAEPRVSHTDIIDHA